MSEKKSRENGAHGQAFGTRRLSTEEAEELRRWGKEAVAYCREEFRKNP
jgi:hypothetical protein